MDSKRIEDIERLLQKMREENSQYRENKQNLYTKQPDNEDDEEENPLQSRYRETKHERIYENETNQIEEDSDDEEDSEEQAKLRIKKRLNELKTRKTKIASMSKAKNILEDEESKPKPQISRPTTAKVIPSYIPSPQIKKRKNDPVALYQQRQKEWKNNHFLKSNSMNTREGRKLNLVSSNHAKDFELSKKKDVHEFIRQNYTAPHEKRRDDVRFQTRAKMMIEPDL